MMADIRVYGAGYSVYVRSVRLALIEKAIPFDLIDVDIFAADGPSTDYLARQPFGRIPAFEHRSVDSSFQLYETSAILRYIEDVFPQPCLQPGSIQSRARMNQALSITDNYVYRCLVWDIYVERISRPAEGKPSDEERIARALPMARRCLQALADMLGTKPWLASDQLTLADLHLAPMFDYFHRTPEAKLLLASHDNLQRWWDRICQRPSMQATTFPES